MLNSSIPRATLQSSTRPFSTWFSKHISKIFTYTCYTTLELTQGNLWTISFLPSYQMQEEKEAEFTGGIQKLQCYGTSLLLPNLLCYGQSIKHCALSSSPEFGFEGRWWKKPIQNVVAFTYSSAEIHTVCNIHNKVCSHLSQNKPLCFLYPT